MVLKSTFTMLLIATLAVFTTTPQTAEAHSWAECVDWKFKNPKRPDYSDKGGKCLGYARRFPLGRRFASLDSAWPNRHYQQTHRKPTPNNALPCSNRRAGEEPGSDETRPKKWSDAYGGKYGRMTVTHVGDTLCLRWPAKNHATKDSYNNPVWINLSPYANRADISQSALNKANIAKLTYKNCMKYGNNDNRACGGCFKVPKRNPGVYLMQWRWMLNKDEWYTSCADINIQGKSKSKRHLNEEISGIVHPDDRI
ncbi:hypothetical protein DFQ27_006821 [Actinomortierella ambigua]|uniref:Secreted protein n=1 Tax=Actinomortierella ambigua TaxID=1343610 RepID=A0A9P6PUN7_9FUNG|nr:hypothetical protein DFQ27_006821 [Actinomortierella ambigua]